MSSRKYFKFLKILTVNFSTFCGKLLKLPVEKTVENFASVSNRQLKNLTIYRLKIKDCANLEKIVRKKVEKNIFLMIF